MAPRRKGTLDLQENIETGKQMPLDARQLVRSKEEMLTEGSFDYGYKGLFTAERTEGKLWMLMDHNNPTLEASWKVIGPYDDSALDARVTALENAPPTEQVQADWEESDTTSKAYIQNKPTIPEAYDDTAIQAALAGKADASSLANVATSGSYNDLGDKPTIPEAYDDSALAARIAAVETTLPNKANTADLANVATSGSYNDLGDKPTIPEAYDDTALAGRVTAVETALPGKADSSSLATVATSGSYNDLSDKPTIPAEVTVDAAMSDASENPVQNKVVLAAIADAIDVVETAIADRYTKAETDAKIAEAMVDVDNEHFHPVTALPDPSVAKENHEYVLITYAQDGTTIESETHYLFYDGVFHEKQTQVSLDGYATEQYVADAFAQHVKTDVPVNAVFTDTVYDDTALAARVTEVEGQHIELTQAQYTALPEEEKNNGKVYFITDGGYYVPAVDIIPHAQQEPIVVGKFDLRGDGEYRNVYRIRRWIGDLKSANTVITAGWTETGVYIRPLRVYGMFTFHDYENTSTGWKYIIQQFPIPYSGYTPREAPSGEKIGLKFYVDHNNKLHMVVDGQSYFNQDDFAQVIIDYIETPIA